MAIPRADHNVIHVFANASAAANTVIVAAQGAGIKIRVLSVFLSAEVNNTVRFTSNGVAITADAYPASTGGFVLIPNPNGWFSTNANESLGIELDSASNVGVQINYQQSQA